MGSSLGIAIGKHSGYSAEASDAQHVRPLLTEGRRVGRSPPGRMQLGRDKYAAADRRTR